tara:strand:+ start:62 stop:559 length:498 start_codon:yes stop_codon:yes gene_type:complete
MAKKNKTSNFIRYKEGLWIPYRYVLYNYWWQFLQIAHQEGRKIDWKYYKEWGTPEEIFSTNFRTWWVKNWERLFAVESRYGVDKFSMTTKQAKPDAIKVALEVYKNKDLKDGWEIIIHLQKKYPTNMMSISGQGATETKEVNRTIKRYKNQTETILKNVCEGKFP